MLIFHEGIPRSGKTYEAIAKHLLPAQQQGRHCYVRIDALHFAQLAELAHISLATCQAILHPLDAAQIPELDKIAIPVGAFLIIDELQNYFPDSRKPLSAEMTRFVAEHDHQGLDIVFMGQDLKDCHKIWRRRVNTKINFTKLDMLGAGNHYHWSLSKAIGPEKFKQVSAGKTAYNKAIFGSYKSFEAGAETAQRYADALQSIWANVAFRKWIPCFLSILAMALYYLYDVFQGGRLERSLIGNKTTTLSVTATPHPIVVVK